MRIRPATVDDAPAVARLVNQAYLIERDFIAGDRTSEADVRALIEGGSTFLLCEDVGCVLVQQRPGDDGDHGYFGMLSVAPSRQGGGIGRALVAAAEAHARAAGCRVMDLSVVSFRLDELVPWYERLGYRVGGAAVEDLADQERLLRPVHLVNMSKPL